MGATATASPQARLITGFSMAACLTDNSELPGWHFTYGLPVRRPCASTSRGVPLRGAEGLFSRVNPNRLKTRCIVARLTRTPAVAANCSQRWASEASGCC